MVFTPTLSPERERQLVELVQRGNRGALGELLGAYHKRIYHLCFRMSGREEDAADLAQDAMMKAIHHIEGFNGASRFSTWLVRIAMNLCISHMRKAKVRSAASLEAGIGGSGGDDGDQAMSLKMMMEQERELSPTLSVETREQIELLQASIERLDIGLKSVILLRDLQDMDYDQIAEVLSLPVGTVKSRLFRARLALRQAMEEANRPRRRSEVADG